MAILSLIGWFVAPWYMLLLWLFGDEHISHFAGEGFQAMLGILVGGVLLALLLQFLTALA